MSSSFEDYTDRELANARALVRRSSTGDFDPVTGRLKSLEEVAAQELIKIRVERIEKQSEAAAREAYAQAHARGIERAGVPRHVASTGEALPQTVVQPPESWRVQSQFGMLRFDATPTGRLVRLADLVQWLMDKNEWPCGVAVERVCSALRTEGADRWLYLLDAGGYAKPLGPSECFAWKPILSFWDQEPAHDEADCGLSGVIKHMAAFWGDETAPSACNYLGREVLDPLAIRLDKAFELWDYGRVSSTNEAVPLVAVALTVEAIKAGAGKNKRGEWTEDALTLIRCAFIEAKRNGERLADVAEKFGLSRQAFSGAATREKKGTRSGAIQTLTVVTSAANRGATR